MRHPRQDRGCRQGRRDNGGRAEELAVIAVLPCDDERGASTLMTSDEEPPAPAGDWPAGEDDPRHVRQVRLPAAPQSAGLARGEVRSSLASWGLGRLEDTAVLLVSELVGNGVRHARHGGGELGLRIADAGAWLRIEVSDSDPRRPRPQSPAGLDESGHGLMLIKALAAKWGVDQGTAGKTVWIELDTRQAEHPGIPPLRGQAAARRDGSQHGQPGPSGPQDGQGSVPANGDAQHLTCPGPVSRAETAALLSGAAALIGQRGWDPLTECWSRMGPLPMDVAIFSVAEARGHDRLDEVLDAVLTHIAGSLYATGEVSRQMLVHDMTDVAMAWEARPGRTAHQVLAMLELTASILDRHDGPAGPVIVSRVGRPQDVPGWPGSVRERPAQAG
jgi:serine/threonine-protein kinase RsbW